MKRGAELSSSPLQPPAAKRRAYDLPPSSSPVRPGTPSTHYPSSPFKSPYPPIPVDSPSNPLGRKRSLASCSSLPLPTTFGQHLPFRFQLIRPGGKKSENVYRIVQVPLSYTFSHLKLLIWYLFGGSYVLRTSEALLKDTEHVFEVKQNVVVQDPVKRPGTLKSGDTVLKLSSTLNPFGYNANEEDDSDADEEDLEDAEEKWKWEAEEDVPLANLWAGPHVDLNKAILYTQYPKGRPKEQTQIHITVNRTKLPKRTGAGNTPHVFEARGLLFLPPTAASSTKMRSLRFKSTRLPREDPEVDIDTDRFNKPEEAFDNYYIANTIPLMQPLENDGDDVFTNNFSKSPSTPSLASSLASSSSPLPFTPSSVYAASSPIRSRSSLHLNWSTSSLPKFTPAPAQEHRKKIEYTKRRMEKLKNMKYIKAIKDAAKEAADKLRKGKAKMEEPEEESASEADELSESEHNEK